MSSLSLIRLKFNTSNTIYKFIHDLRNVFTIAEMILTNG